MIIVKRPKVRLKQILLPSMHLLKVAATFAAALTSAAARIIPQSVPVNFANKISLHYVDSTYSETPVLYFGNVWYPYDRPLPTAGGNLCLGNEGTIAVDESVQEQYKYSCCARNRCPLPPPDSPDVIQALLFSRPVEIWGWNGTRQDAWQKLPQLFTFYDEPSPVGFAKRFLAVVVISTFIVGVLSIVASLLHKGTNMYPSFCLVIHGLTLACIGIITGEAFKEVSNDRSYRGMLIRAGLVHTYIIMLFSPILIYTPSGSSASDQRVSSRCGKILTKHAHSKHSRRFASVVCLLHALVGDVLGSYALMDSTWSILDAELDVLVGVGLCYAIGTTIHVVAFITAIHEVEVPLRIDDPRGVARPRAKVNVQRHFVGVHDETNGLVPVPGWKGTPFHVYAMRECAAGITLAVWHVGHFESGRLEFDNASITGRCGGQSVEIRLPDCEQEEVTIVVCNSVGDFERLGMIQAGKFHYDLSLTASIIRTILHIAPRPENDEYAMNVVHNQRSWLHGVQSRRCGKACGQPVYGMTWWAGLSASSIAAVIIILSNAEGALIPFYALELLAVLSLLLFGAVVGLVEDSSDTRIAPSGGSQTFAPTMRDGAFTCFSGHRCMLVDASYNWYDDITGEKIPQGTPTYYCYRCEACFKKG